MLDIKLIRENPDLVRQAMNKRQDSAPVEEILALDEQRRRLLQDVEAQLARQRKIGVLIGRAKAKRSEAELHSILDQAQQLGFPASDLGAPGDVAEALLSWTKSEQKDSLIQDMKQQVTRIEEQLNDLLLRIPNIPHSSVPVGKSSEDNVVVRHWGELRAFDFAPRPHWELGEKLGIIDFERGVKLSGSRFYVLKGLGARLQRALIAFMLQLHTTEHGYTEIYPPFMVKRECLVGSGNLPKFADHLYHDEADDFWFIPTAEVPLTNLFREEILEPGTLPAYFAAYTACFRREKMSAGKDIRGIKRGHQFDKVELYKFVEPQTSDQELDRLVNDAESICQKLGLPYRVVQLCTADLGFASMKSFDLEMWAPGCGEWLEVSSCSNCGDFQARRANIRYRPEAGAKPQFVHTLNGSGLALPRVLISVLENYQQPDGSVVVPEVLRPFMGVSVIKK